MSFANALRRIILSEIPINVIRTETEEVNQCKITTNTGRLHNEIIKQRLSCIPIHLTDLDLLPEKYELEVKVEKVQSQEAQSVDACFAFVGLLLVHSKAGLLKKYTLQWNAKIQTFGFQTVPKSERSIVRTSRVQLSNVRFVRMFGFRTDR